MGRNTLQNTTNHLCNLRKNNEKEKGKKKNHKHGKKSRNEIEHFKTHTPSHNIALTIANPTSAILRAGASLVPSPVTATTCRISPACELIIPFTRTYLSCGEERARTRSFGHTLSMRSWHTCAGKRCLRSPLGEVWSFVGVFCIGWTEKFLEVSVKLFLEVLQGEVWSFVKVSVR